MTLKEYQQFCLENWSPAIQKCPQLYFAVGLAGECGEACEEIKKAFRDERAIDKEKLSKELGDVMWYLANICSTSGILLSDVLEANKAKLDARHGGTYKAGRADSEVFYQMKGPHIEMVERATGKHIKFCKKAEVPDSVMHALKALSPVCIAEPLDKAPWEE